MNRQFVNFNNAQARILLYSQRGLLGNPYYRLALYEFEDIIRQVDSVDLLSPTPNRFFKYGTRIANRLSYNFNTAINPGISRIKVKKNYDLFLAVVAFPKDLLHIRCLEGWKENCRKSICWLNEIWVSEIHRHKCHLDILSEFDYVIVHWAGSIDAVQERVQGKCFYLPDGIDTILFCPYPDIPNRVIDVYSIGRRSEETHKTLLKMARKNSCFYVYDTIQGDQVKNPYEHRLLYANMAKRSRYFIVNPGIVTQPDLTQGQIEIGMRYFEGAASGTVMIGETPRNEQFEKIFSWPDAVINLPFGSDKIDTIINELEAHPDRQENIRRENVVRSLLHHDWVYRWEDMLNIVGLDPMPQLSERKNRLRDLSNMIEKGILP